MNIGTNVREAKGPERTNDWLLQRATRNGVLLGIPLLFGSLILSVWLYEKTGHTDRAAVGPWFLTGLVVGVFLVCLLVFFLYRRAKAKSPETPPLRLGTEGFAADDRSVSWADAAHLLAAISWDAETGSWMWDFRWFDVAKKELLRIGGWEKTVISRIDSAGALVADGAIAHDGALALVLEAEERFASHQLVAASSQYEFHSKSGAIRTDSNGIQIDGRHFPWSDLLGATRTKGILVITIKNGPAIEFSRNDGADFALFAKVLSRAGVSVEVQPPLEPCWQRSDISVSEFGLPSERIV